MIDLHGHRVCRADRSAVDTSKNRGGSLCIYINKTWCIDSSVLKSHSSADFEFLMIKCQPFNLPGEFTAAVLTAVYVPLEANAKLAVKKLHVPISTQLKTHPDGAFVIVGDFNKSNLRTVSPRFFQNLSCPTKGDTCLVPLRLCSTQNLSTLISEYLRIPCSTEEISACVLPLSNRSLIKLAYGSSVAMLSRPK